jgi:hypothetical protein
VGIEGDEITGKNGERVVLAWDGWYIGDPGSESRVTVDQAVHAAGKFGRAQVLTPTRKYVAWIGARLADGSWTSPLSPAGQQRVSGKIPAEQIAHAGAVISTLGKELGDAEMAPIPDPKG